MTWLGSSSGQPPSTRARGRHTRTGVRPIPPDPDQDPDRARDQDRARNPAGDPARDWPGIRVRRTEPRDPRFRATPRFDNGGEPATGSVRWVAGSTGRTPTARRRRQDFPRSSLAAWEAVVTHGQPVEHRRAGAVATRPRPVGRVQVPEPAEAGGVEANARLTGMTAAVLLVLFAIEGITILRVRSLLTVHVVVGMLLLPPVLLKIGSTGWRFTRYYLGSPEYRRKGPPPPLLRLLGPFVVVLTLAVIGSGIALVVSPPSMLNTLFALHRDTFVLWFMAMVVHVLGHFLETTNLAPADFYHRTRSHVRGAGARRWAIATSLAVGLILGIIMAPKAATWLTETSARPTPVAKPTATTIVPGSPTTAAGSTGAATTGTAKTGTAKTSTAKTRTGKTG